MAGRLFINRKQDFKDTQKRHAIVHRLQIRPMLHGLYIILVLSCLIVACFSFYKMSQQMELGIERVQACILAHISRSRYNTRSMGEMEGRARSRRVDFIAGEGSLRRHA